MILRGLSRVFKATERLKAEGDGVEEERRSRRLRMEDRRMKGKISVLPLQPSVFSLFSLTPPRPLYNFFQALKMFKKFGLSETLKKMYKRSPNMLLLCNLAIFSRG
jgi:hypothetical protein